MVEGQIALYAHTQRIGEGSNWRRGRCKTRPRGRPTIKWPTDGQWPAGAGPRFAGRTAGGPVAGALCTGTFFAGSAVWASGPEDLFASGAAILVNCRPFS